MSFASSVIAPRPRWSIPFLADARYFQIATLATLLALQICNFDLCATAAQAAVTLVATIATQLACNRIIGTKFDWRSPLITGLSLTLLLRTHSPELWFAAGLLAIGSKYLLRWRGKHIFNPATFAICTLLLVSPDVWVSPGQWGDAVWLSFLLMCCAGLVLQRAERADTALAFLASFAGLLLLRAWSLGDPLAIPLHQLQSGALLLFSFFMITDPRSTPDHRLARIGFAMAVAGLAYWLTFRWQMRTGVFFALFALSPLTPILDRLFPVSRFVWRSPKPHPSMVEA
jgi:enediyne biosynthesis protein E5